jgi:uncharacterized membrane protein
MPVMPRQLRRLSLYTMVLALVVGAIVHISATLLIPQLAKASAFQRLSDTLPTNRMRVLPPADAESQPIPYLGPDVRLAICRYDVSDGPVVVTLALPDKGWTLGLYSMQGDNFYVLAAPEQRSSDLTLTLLARGERSFSLLTLGRKHTITSISQIEVPDTTGFVVIRAPLRGRAFAAEVETTLRRAQCGARRGS